MDRNQDKMNRANSDQDQTNPMTNKQDVERSKDERTDQDFPGYPHYPAKDDILNRSDAGRVDVDVENLPSGRNATGVSQRFVQGQENRTGGQAAPGSSEETDDLGIAMGTDGDVTEDDLIALNSTDAEIGTPQKVSNEDINTDLDVPGSELDDTLEEAGEEDEENNYYSLGGDRHESQEENPDSGPVRD